MESLTSKPTGTVAAIIGAIALLVACAALFDLGPCADDDLTVAEFVEQGDELCRDAHDEFLDLQESAPKTPTDAAELTSALIEVAEEERDAIADLREPDALSDRVQRYLDARERGIELLHEGLDAAEETDAAAYEAVQAELAGSQLDPRYEIARAIGFKECSKPLVDRDELERQSQPPAPSDPSAPPVVNNPPT